MLFADLLSLHLVTFLMFFILVQMYMLHCLVNSANPYHLTCPAVEIQMKLSSLQMTGVVTSIDGSIREFVDGLFAIP